MDAFNRIFELEEKDRLDLFLQRPDIYEDQKVIVQKKKHGKN